MMTSSNEDIFRVTGHLCGEFTVPGEFSTQRPVTRSFDVYFDLRPNEGLSKQLWGWWFETQSCPLWRHRNAWQKWVNVYASTRSDDITIAKQSTTKPWAVFMGFIAFYCADDIMKDGHRYTVQFDCARYGINTFINHVMNNHITWFSGKAVRSATDVNNQFTSCMLKSRANWYVRRNANCIHEDKPHLIWYAL